MEKALRLPAFFLLLCLALGPARADTGTPPTELPGMLEPAVQAAVGLARAAVPIGGAKPSRVEVVVGSLDPRLHLAPCDKIEPYLPNGAVLWGRSRVGLRCLVGPTRWNVSLPITVRVYGQALVLTGGKAAGSVIAAGDLSLAEVDLAAAPGATYIDSAALVGRSLAQSVAAGEPVRLTQLKTRQWFAAGETVHLTFAGAGFSVDATGEALSAGLEGSPARIKLESGRVLTGKPVAEREVEVAL